MTHPVLAHLAAAADRPGPVVMGVVNVTPDSFSDGGRWIETGAALAHARALVAEGALVVSSVEEALDAAREETARTQAPYIWITGGAQLYAQTLPFLDEAVVTDLELDVAASAPQVSAFVYAPPLQPALWRRDENRSDAEWRERSGDARWKVSTWVQR